MINDITTDFENPPQFQYIKNLRPGKNYEYPNRFKDEQQKLYPDLKALVISRPAAECFLKTKEIISSQCPIWKHIGGDENKLSLEYVDTTKLLRFKDDVVIEFRETPESHCEIHMRSKSRVGRDDFGKNAARINALFEILSTELN